MRFGRAKNAVFQKQSYSTRTSTKLNKAIVIAFALHLGVSAILSCGTPKGTFAFKGALDDRYHTLSETPEFEQGSPAEWAYVFNKNYGLRTFGIVVLKKELVWVEVSRRTASIDKTSRIIYGSLGDLSTGQYKIIITEKATVIDEREFVIYAGEDDEDFDRD